MPEFSRRTLLAAAAGMGVIPAGGAAGPGRLRFVCGAHNDLYRIASKALGGRVSRYDTCAAALVGAASGMGLLVLADGYPERLTTVPSEVFAAATAAGLRLYVECPGGVPGLAIEPLRATEWERLVVASDLFGADLRRDRILMAHGCRFSPVAGPGVVTHLVVARVAGFDTACFGLPAESWPILLEMPNGPLVATTSLSSFASGRFAPSEAWRRVWGVILGRLLGRGVEDGAIDLRWQAPVRPTFGREEPLPADAERTALRRAMAWFSHSRMLVHPDWEARYDTEAVKWPDRIGPWPGTGVPAGDGSLGVMEGFNAAVQHDGSQRARWWRRNDCNGESAGAFALAGVALRSPRLSHVGGNIGDWLYTRSILSHGKRLDPTNAAYGLIGWNDVTRYYGDMDGYGVYYGDDMARSMLGMMMAGSALKSSRWDRRLLHNLLACMRFSGTQGFQPDRIDTAPLEANGWRAYHASGGVSLSPHYQSYLFACYLWAFRATGFEPFRDQAMRGIRTTMEAYPDRWAWTGSMQLERSRMLLCLAWLVRVHDTPEHRGWLRKVASDMLALQDPSGGIREQLGKPGMGTLSPPSSNAAYGTAETPLIQTNDDAACDLLYCANFAFIGLHEAAAATGEALYREAGDRLAAYVVRAQVRSEKRPELDGAWFRALDLNRWEYWAQNADAGWGAWSIESGWTVTWLSMVLALRLQRKSFWSATEGSRIGDHMAGLVTEMLPDGK